MEEERLRFRRQFLLSREAIPELPHWPCRQLANELYVYAHPDLGVSYAKKGEIDLVLFGYIFDSVNQTKRDEEILDDIVSRTTGFEDFLEALRNYAGQYVFLYRDAQSRYLVHDPLGLREVYYCTSHNRIICGSQPNIIRAYASPPVKETKSAAIQDFYKKDMPLMRSGRFWVGDETYYDGVKHLLPNHYLDIDGLHATRYWPRRRLEALNLADVVQRSCSFLQGVLKAASSRYDLMMAVTAGTDSRTLLAASRDIKDRIYYFVNRVSHISDEHPDIFIPKALFEKIGLPFHVHSLDGTIDENFRRVFLANTFLASDLVLPAIFNIYYKHHSHRMNLLGVGEIGRAFFGREPHDLSGYYLARSLKYKNSSYAVQQCQNWLDALKRRKEQYGISTMVLLLWEQLLGNWGAVGNSESDIVFEEFDPFNSHYMYETLLGVKGLHLKQGRNDLFVEMIRYMWPELLDLPINPPVGMAGHIRQTLRRSGLYEPLKSLVYRIDSMRFRNCRRHP